MQIRTSIAMGMAGPPSATAARSNRERRAAAAAWAMPSHPRTHPCALQLSRRQAGVRITDVHSSICRSHSTPSHGAAMMASTADACAEFLCWSWRDGFPFVPATTVTHRMQCSRCILVHRHAGVRNTQLRTPFCHRLTDRTASVGSGRLWSALVWSALLPCRSAAAASASHASHSMRHPAADSPWAADVTR